MRTAVLVNLAFVTCALCAQPAEREAPPDALTGEWRARIKLEDNGVVPFAILTAEEWGNVDGGLESGSRWNTLLDFGLKLDTERLGWWQGGSVMAQLHWVESQDDDIYFSRHTGAASPVSGIMAHDHLRVFNLYYQQSWREDAYRLKLGQQAADDDFMGSDYAGLFLNSAFGAMPSQVATPLASCCGNSPAFPIYPVAAPGIFFSARPSEPLYAQIGAYYGRPGVDEASNHGFDWVNQSPPELGMFWEAGYAYRLQQRLATLRLGLSYHTGPLDDYSANITGSPSATRQSVPNFYAIHDLQLLVDAEGKTKLGLFWRGGITPEPSLSMVAAYTDAGLNWFAPMPNRPDDVAGAAVSYTRFGRAYKASTGANGVAADETTVELTYKAQLTRWLAMQADVQFLLNPTANPRSNRRETATVLGLRAEITF